VIRLDIRWKIIRTLIIFPELYLKSFICCSNNIAIMIIFSPRQFKYFALQIALYTPNGLYLLIYFDGLLCKVTTDKLINQRMMIYVMDFLFVNNLYRLPFTIFKFILDNFISSFSSKEEITFRVVCANTIYIPNIKIGYSLVLL